MASFDGGSLAKGQIEEATLIELVKRNECFYNFEIPDYKRDHVKQKAWEEIAKTLGLKQHDAVHQLKTKWKYLRDSYVRKITANRQKIAAGEEPDESWRHYENMQWLNPFLHRGIPRQRNPNWGKVHRQSSTQHINQPDDVDPYYPHSPSEDTRPDNAGHLQINYYTEEEDDLELGDTAASIKAEPRNFEPENDFDVSQLSRASQNDSNSDRRYFQATTSTSNTPKTPETPKRKRAHSDEASDDEFEGLNEEQRKLIRECARFGREVAIGLHYLKDVFQRECAKRAIRDILFKARFPNHAELEAARQERLAQANQAPTSTNAAGGSQP